MDMNNRQDISVVNNKDGFEVVPHAFSSQRIIHVSTWKGI